MNRYENITDFEWYVGVLLDVTHIPTAKCGDIIKDQLLELSLRVTMIRPFIVKNMLHLIEDVFLRTEVFYRKLHNVLEYRNWRNV